MATPIPDSRFVGLFRAEGIPVREHPGWASHNRGNRGTGWGPINGVLIHHTGSDTSGSGQVYNDNILWSGYSGLPGPLCHVGIGPDGTLHINSNGRANHAGGGDPAVLDAVVGEAAWLMDREAKPRRGNSNGVDGNSRFYGAEIMYSGGHAMTANQYDTAVKFAAAICRHYGWSARSVIGHREWSSDKIDPGHCPMTTFRRDVQFRLDHADTGSLSGGAGGMGGGGPTPLNPTPAPTPSRPVQPTPAPTDWFDMATEAQLRAIVADEIHKTNGSWNTTQTAGQFLPVATADAILARRGVPIDPGITPAVGGKPDERSTANAISMAIGFAWRASRDAAQALALVQTIAQRQGLSQDDITAALNTALKQLGAEGQTVVNINTGGDQA